VLEHGDVWGVGFAGTAASRMGVGPPERWLGAHRHPSAALVLGGERVVGGGLKMGLQFRGEGAVAGLRTCTSGCTNKFMSKRYSIAEARSNLPTIVDQVEAGQEIELTRRGKPVAVVVSLRELERLRSKSAPFGESYKRFLKAHSLREIGLDRDFFDSARDRASGRKVVL